MAVNPSTNQVFVLNAARDLGWTIDGQTNEISAKFILWDLPSAIAVNAVTNRMYVSNRSQGNVSVIYGNEVLKNASLDSPGEGVPDAWRGRNLDQSDLPVGFRPFPPGPVYDGKFSFRMTGAAGVTKQLEQGVRITGPAGSVLNVEGFSRAEAPGPEGAYKIKVKVHYVDGTSDRTALHFSKTTHDWERRAKSFTATKDFERIVLSLVYANSTGRVWFDALHLWR